MKLKRTLALIMTGVVLLLALASCAPGSDQSSQSPSTGSSSPSAGQPSNNPAVEPDKKDLTGKFELSLFSAKEATDRWFTEVIEDFKKEYPNLEVSYYLSPTNGDEIRTRWIDDNPPDLCYLQGAASGDVNTLIFEGRMLPIDDFFYDSAKVWGTDTLVKDIVLLESAQFDNDGRPVGFPVEAGTYGLFYDKNLAAKLGVTEMPRTIDDMIALGKRLETEHPEVALLAYAGKSGFGYLTNQWVMPLLCEIDPDLYLRCLAQEPGIWNDPRLAEIMTKIKEVSQYAMPGCLGLTHTEMQIAWLQGYALFCPNGTWIEGEVLEDTPDDFEMAMIPYPTMNASSNPVCFFYVDTNIFVPKVSVNNNKDAVYEFMRFMYQEKYQQNYAAYVRNNPGTRVSLEGIETSPMMSSVSDVLIDPNIRVAQPRIGGWPTIYRAEGRKFWVDNQMLVIMDEMSVSDFFKGMEESSEIDRNAEDFLVAENFWLKKP